MNPDLRVAEIMRRTGYPTDRDDLDILAIRLGEGLDIALLACADLLPVCDFQDENTAIVTLRSGGRYRVSIAVEEVRE